MAVMTTHEDDVAGVSWNPKGFWQADLFPGWRGATWRDWQDGPIPHEFFTLEKGCTEDDARRRAAEKWPGCKVILMVQEEDDEEDDE